VIGRTRCQPPFPFDEHRAAGLVEVAELGRDHLDRQRPSWAMRRITRRSRFVGGVLDGGAQLLRFHHWDQDTSE